VTSSNYPVLQAGICDYGLATAVKKTGNKPGNIRNLLNSGVRKTRPAMLVIRNSTILPVISQKTKLNHFPYRVVVLIFGIKYGKKFSRSLKINSFYLHQFKKPTVIPTHLFMSVT